VALDRRRVAVGEKIELTATAKVRPAMKVRLVSDRPADANFVAAVLDPDTPLSPQSFVVIRKTTDRFQAREEDDLSEYSCVFLLNVARLDQGSWGSLNVYEFFNMRQFPTTGVCPGSCRRIMRWVIAGHHRPDPGQRGWIAARSWWPRRRGWRAWDWPRAFRMPWRPGPSAYRRGRRSCSSSAAARRTSIPGT
jgi:hypothetical protein